jgi:hypothetical protein
VFIKIAIFGVMVALVLAIGCKPQETDVVDLLGDNLNFLYTSWEKAGRPNSFQISDYLESHPASYFIYTNTIRVGENVYHCRFGARSPNFMASGVLAIADGRTMLWIRDSDGRVVVSPEKKGLRTDR